MNIELLENRALYVGATEIMEDSNFQNSSSSLYQEESSSAGSGFFNVSNTVDMVAGWAAGFVEGYILGRSVTLSTLAEFESQTKPLPFRFIAEVMLSN